MSDDLSAVLLDLDGTLLANNMDVFLPHYFELLARRVSHILPPKQFVRLLMQATGSMMRNDGRRTNQEVFADAFYPALGHPEAEMELTFMDFYRNDFPALQQYTQPVPEARRVVEAAFARGCAVVIATNPLFPAIAMQQRLEWAGVGDYPYRLVTSYENSRACKPNPIYFQQILEELRLPASATLVVGNEWGDMVAGHLGCKTFFLGDPATLDGQDVPPPAYHGTLSDLAALLETPAADPDAT